MVTSLGGHEVDLAGWGVDIAYSCTQKCIGAPSGMAPIAVSGPARERLVPCRSFYLDLKLLEDYWVGRKYHHTMSSTLIYALREALLMVEEEGLAARQARHERNHRALAAGIEAMGLSLLPPEAERLWTLNAVRMPAGVDEAAVRRTLLTNYNIEVGAGLGPLAGKIWRVGPDGCQLDAADAAAVPRCVRRRAGDARAQRARRRGRGGGIGVAARGARHGVERTFRAGGPRGVNSSLACLSRSIDERPCVRRRRSGELAGQRWSSASSSAAGAHGVAAVRFWPGLLRLSHASGRAASCDGQPDDDRVHETARARSGRRGVEAALPVSAWVPYSRISPNLKRAVLVAEDSAFWDHEGHRRRGDPRSRFRTVWRGARRRAARARSRSSSPRISTCRRRTIRCGRSRS